MAVTTGVRTAGIDLPDVQTLLSGPLGDWLGEQREARRAARAQAMNRLWKAAIVLGPLLIFAWIAVPFGTDIKMFASAAAGAGAWAWSQGPITAAKKRVKIGINEAVAHALGFVYDADVEPGRAFASAKLCGMVPKHDRARFEDSWQGTLAGRRFALHEAHLEERRGSGKNRRWVTVFRGAVLTLEFGRRFHGKTLLLREGKHRKFLGGRKDAITIDGEQFLSAPFVHPGFEDIFDAWTTDPAEARYLIHPTYVERLIAIEEGFAGKDICAFFDGSAGGELVVTLRTANMFESGSMNAAHDESRIAATIRQFGTLASLAATLNEMDETP